MDACTLKALKTCTLKTLKTYAHTQVTKDITKAPIKTALWSTDRATSLSPFKQYNLQSIFYNI